MIVSTFARMRTALTVLRDLRDRGLLRRIARASGSPKGGTHLLGPHLSMIATEKRSLTPSVALRVALALRRLSAESVAAAREYRKQTLAAAREYRELAAVFLAAAEEDGGHKRGRKSKSPQTRRGRHGWKKPRR